jgi:hypothetical protein
VISGDYFTFTAAANTPYTFTFCMGGGTANYNTHITILDATTGMIVQDYNDDACGGGRSMISHFWTASGGNYRVLIRRTGCAGPVGGDAATMAYRQEAPLPATGNTCANAYVIPSLPFTASSMWTCGMGNEYNSSHACLSTFMNGDDFVFRFTTISPRCLNISVTGNYTFSAVFLLNGCPDVGGTTCVAKSEIAGAGPPTLTGVSIPAGTYYIVVDKSNIPDCTPFNISVQDCPAVGGNTCSNAALITSLPYVQSGFTTAGFGNDYTQLDKCLSDYMRGEDFVFRYDATGPTCIDVLLTGTNTYTGVHVLDGCPNSGATNCIAWEGSPDINPHLRNVSLPSAGDYYIVVDTWSPTTPTTPFTITVRNCVDYCSLNPEGANGCAAAPLLTYPLDSFCGTTYPSPTYTVDAPGNLASTFCGSLENNQWFRFTADNDTMVFNVQVSDCWTGNGIQAMVVSTSDCNTFTAQSNCFDPGSAVGGTVTCNSLTVGNTYYFMVDGWAEDDCNFMVRVVRPTTPMPVEWLHFEAKAQDEQVALKWATSQEHGNSKFIVERGIKYIHPLEREAYRWTEVGEVSGAGNSDAVSQYTFLDHPPYHDEPYLYRIRQIDLDGQSTVSEVREVQPGLPEETVMLSLFPNPAREETHLRLVLAEACKAELVMADIRGQIVMQRWVELQPGVQDVAIDVTQLSEGIYTCLLNVQGRALRGKVTVLRP